MSNDDRQTNEQIWNQLKTIKNFAFPCGIKTLENPIKELKLKTQRTNDKTLHTEKKKNRQQTNISIDEKKKKIDVNIKSFRSRDRNSSQ